MPFFAFISILSLVFYLFYKVKYVRSRLPFERKWLAAKCSISLGAFVLFFGVNQLFLFDTTVTYIVAAVFIILGGMNVWGGFKAYRFFLPMAIEEAENQQNA
ncbi:MAG: YtpI family protein [Bacillus sp. (in: firmicutes)]